MPWSLLPNHWGFSCFGRKRMAGSWSPIQPSFQLKQSQSGFRVHSNISAVFGHCSPDPQSIPYGFWIQPVLPQIFGLSSCLMSISYFFVWLRNSEKSGMCNDFLRFSNFCHNHFLTKIQWMFFFNLYFRLDFWTTKNRPRHLQAETLIIAQVCKTKNHQLVIILCSIWISWISISRIFLIWPNFRWRNWCFQFFYSQQVSHFTQWSPCRSQCFWLHRSSFSAIAGFP